MSHNYSTNPNQKVLFEVDTKSSDNDSYLTIEQTKNQAEPGQILELQWGSYTHFVLYLGEGNVMNIELKEFEKSQAHIRERTLGELCHDNKVRFRNHDVIAHKLFQLKPKPISEIIQDAFSFKNQVVPYEFDFRNCEYYCTLWRYGKGFCAEPERNPAVFCQSCFEEKLAKSAMELKPILKEPSVQFKF